MYQKLVKKQDFCVKMSENDPKNTKSQQIETFPHVIEDKNCKFLKIPIGKLPRVYFMYEKKAGRGGG